ncbi:protein tyrosine phosphatase type IVA 1 [Neoconidiobolus thromboides FSU 785]|nr:protein tyrosine phosphatase type IVA 1 [Neoconidiobolus thromboides FSU 785]
MSSKSRLLNPFTLIEYGGLRFLIFDSPTVYTLPLYIKELKAHGVTDVVRACEATYPAESLRSSGINVFELPFDDGKAPPISLVTDWLDIVNARFPKGEESKATIGIHCVAGLGR